MLVEYSHELYNYSVTLDMYLNFVPKFHGRYLSSNVNITIARCDGSVVSVPVGGQCYNRLSSDLTRILTLCAIRRSFCQVQDTEVGHASFKGKGGSHHISRGRKVTSLGVLFNFTGNNRNTTVQPVGEMVKEAWVGYVIHDFVPGCLYPSR